MTSRRTPAVSPLPIWAGGLGALALCFLVLPLAFMLGRVNWATLGATLATDEASAASAGGPLSVRIGEESGLDVTLEEGRLTVDLTGTRYPHGGRPRGVVGRSLRLPDLLARSLRLLGCIRREVDGVLEF